MKLHNSKALIALFLVTIFLIIPVFGTAAIWVQHVGLLPGTAVVFPSDAAAMDRFMATALKQYYGDRVGICDGTNDHVEIQAALDAVSEVRLSEGTFNCEVQIDLDSDQTLRGCGWNTILTTSTADLVFLSAVGGAGTELTGIIIADLQIDGGAGAVSGCGIFFNYVDFSFIENVYSRRHVAWGMYDAGIWLFNSDCNTLCSNICQGNAAYGICLRYSNNNSVQGNLCQGDGTGIQLRYCDNNSVQGNTCLENSGFGYGIFLEDCYNNSVQGNLCQGDGTGMWLHRCDNNSVQGNTCNRNGDYGIYIRDCSYNSVQGNTCNGNGETGIYLRSSLHNTISGNTCQNNGADGIAVAYTSHNNAVTGNTCQGNQAGDGIYLYTSDYNAIIGNTCQGNNLTGIRLYYSDNNIVADNTFTENSQGTTNTDDDICLEGSDFNLIQSNICRAGALANVPRYGICISNSACDDNLVIDNDLSGGGWGTAPFSDAGTGTKLNVFVAPFVDGTDPQDSGFLIDADTEYGRVYLRLPGKVTQVVRIKVYARSVVAEADKMRGEFVVYGAADNENYQTHTGSVANHPSTSSNFAADDVIYWTITTAGVLALQGGDSIEVKVLHEAAANGDCATNAYFRTAEIEYIS